MIDFYVIMFCLIVSHSLLLFISNLCQSDFLTIHDRSFYTGIGIHRLLDDGTLGPETEVHGLPDGAKINFVTW